MHLKIFPLLLVECFRTALITALPQQTFSSGQNSQDIYAPYSNIPQEKWPRYKGQLVDPTCILTNLGKEHQKREWPRIPQPAYPSPGYCPAWQQDTEKEADGEDRDLCGDGFEPRCCVGKAYGFGLGTVNTPCYQYMTAVHCKTQYKGETYCCEKFPAFPLDGSTGFNCRPVTFVSVPTFQASSSSSPYSSLENPFPDTISTPKIPSNNASSDQELINSATADLTTADFNGNNYINVADASKAYVGNSEVYANPSWVD